MVAIDDGGQLWRFDSNSVATATTLPLSGLVAGDTAVALDYGVEPVRVFLLARAAAGAGRLYTLDPATAVASVIAPLAADPLDVTAPYTSLAGTNYNLEFDPVAHRLRIVSDADINLTVDPATGLVVSDSPLFYSASDVGAGLDPNVTCIAYGNTVPGAIATTLFGADPPRFRFVEIPDPASGAMRTRDLTASFSLNTGLDILSRPGDADTGYATSYIPSLGGYITVYRVILQPFIALTLESSVQTPVHLVDSAAVILSDDLFRDDFE